MQRAGFYKPWGQLDLLFTQIVLAGEGELLRRRAELMTKLSAEGFCDPARWPALPRFPRAVGLIAGKGSDGMSDVMCAIHNRFPPAEVITCDSLVQGKAAPRQIIDALVRLQEHPLVDVIVIAAAAARFRT